MRQKHKKKHYTQGQTETEKVEYLIFEDIEKEKEMCTEKRKKIENKNKNRRKQ